MTLLASRSNRLNAVLAHEYAPDFGYCRKSVTVVVESGMDVGAVLRKTLVSGSASAAITGTGNGSIGTVTVGAVAQVGAYVLRIVTAVANGGSFVVVDPAGNVVGNGVVGTAFSGGGLSFTLADGSTDFVAGDKITITVTGTEKWDWVAAADIATLPADVGILVETEKDVPSLTAGDHTLAIMFRGPAGVKNTGLEYADSLNTTQKAAVVAALEAKGIAVRTGV